MSNEGSWLPHMRHEMNCRCDRCKDAHVNGWFVRAKPKPAPAEPQGDAQVAQEMVEALAFDLKKFSMVLPERIIGELKHNIFVHLVAAEQRATQAALKMAAKHGPEIGKWGQVIGCSGCDWRPDGIDACWAKWQQHIRSLSAPAQAAPAKMSDETFLQRADEENGRNISVCNLKPPCECGHGKYNHATERGTACLVGDCDCAEYKPAAPQPDRLVAPPTPIQELTPKQARSLGLSVPPNVVRVLVYGGKLQPLCGRRKAMVRQS